MKILAIHNFHRKGSASGDDQVFKSETALLESYGNEVIRYTVSNNQFDNAGLIGKLSATFGMLWNLKSYKAVQQLIEKEKPDIVHVHTFFPLLSPSILYAARRSGTKVVATLHDTRFVCPCSTSLRGTELCNECGDGKYFRMCKYGCFKNSRLQSFIVAGIFTYHRIRKSFYKQIDHYICLNENQIRLLTNIGFDREKITKKYNFVLDAEANLKARREEALPNRYVVFYGRIGEEKGIRILMKIWDNLSDIPLVVMGSGPFEEAFKCWAEKHNNVYFLGYTNLDTVMLGFIKTDIDVGYYNAAVKIKSVLLGIVTSLGSVLLPRASYYIEHHEMDEFRRITKKALNFVFLISVPLTVYFILYAKEGILFLSGDAYISAVLPMQIIMPTIIFIGLTNIMGIQMLVPLGREKIVLYSEVAGAIVDLILNAILIPRLSSAGAAIGTLVAEGVVWIVQFAALKREVILAYKNVHYGTIILATIVGVASSGWVKMLEMGNFLILVFSALFFFGGYGIILTVLKEPFVWEIESQVLKKINSRMK